MTWLRRQWQWLALLLLVDLSCSGAVLIYLHTHDCINIGAGIELRR